MFRRLYTTVVAIAVLFPSFGKPYANSIKISSGQQSLITWTGYPGYQEYMDFMYNCALFYPQLCSLDSIGSSTLGKEIIALKISDNAHVDEDEPKIFYTSSIHGNELTGYYLMIKLIDYLLTQYENNNYIKSLVDNIQIYINPLSNPDGTYIFSSDTIIAPSRNNFQNIDINRNFPTLSRKTDSIIAPETQAMMDFMDSITFVLSANFHSGAELVNYPWDSKQELHPDNDWFAYVSKQYADTNIFYSEDGYFQTNEAKDGYINGFEWFYISGGRQDYVNYYLSVREVTIELSVDKIPSVDKLPTYWEYNYRSLLNYIQQAAYGLQGKVLNAENNSPIYSAIKILNHDQDFSVVRTSKEYGSFYRPIYEGVYDVVASAKGYAPDTIYNVTVYNNQTTSIDFYLTPSSINNISRINNLSKIKIINTINGIELINNQPDIILQNIKIYDLNGRLVKNENIQLSYRQNISIALPNIKPGIYFISIYDNINIYTTKFIKY